MALTMRQSYIFTKKHKNQDSETVLEIEINRENKIVIHVQDLYDGAGIVIGSEDATTIAGALQVLAGVVNRNLHKDDVWETK